MEKLDYITSRLENKQFASLLKTYNTYDDLYTIASDWMWELSPELVEEYITGNNSSAIILYFIHQKKLLISHEGEGYQFDMYARDYDGYVQVSCELASHKRMEFLAAAE
jgi:hypothetical protein